MVIDMDAVEGGIALKEVGDTWLAEKIKGFAGAPSADSQDNTS